MLVKMNSPDSKAGVPEFTKNVKISQLVYDIWWVACNIAYSKYNILFLINGMSYFVKQGIKQRPKGNYIALPIVPPWGDMTYADWMPTGCPWVARRLLCGLQHLKSNKPSPCFLYLSL